MNVCAQQRFDGIGRRVRENKMNCETVSQFPDFANKRRSIALFEAGKRPALERFKKYCSRSVKERRLSGLFGFWRRFGSVTGSFKPAPSPKPRQKPKILAPN